MFREGEKYDLGVVPEDDKYIYPYCLLDHFPIVPHCDVVLMKEEGSKVPDVMTLDMGAITNLAFNHPDPTQLKYAIALNFIDDRSAYELEKQVATVREVSIVSQIHECMNKINQTILSVDFYENRMVPLLRQIDQSMDALMNIPNRSDFHMHVNNILCTKKDLCKAVFNELNEHEYHFKKVLLLVQVLYGLLFDAQSRRNSHADVKVRRNESDIPYVVSLTELPWGCELTINPFKEFMDIV